MFSLYDQTSLFWDFTMKKLIFVFRTIMRSALFIIVFALIPIIGMAQEDPAVDSLSSEDSVSFLPLNVGRAYKVWIKTSIREDIYYGFLYRLNEHSITICNLNPK